MNEVSQISEFGKIFIFVLVGLILVATVLMLNRLIAPNKPNAEKLTSYECGEDPVGSAWIPFNTRFYVIALIFLLFDVEMVFIFPWTTVYANKSLAAADSRWSTFALAEMFIFASILILGLVYVWRKGDLEWIKPHTILPQVEVNIPASVYEKVNLEQQAYAVKAFTVEQPDFIPPIPASTEPAPAAIRKPMFKPTFKKPADESGKHE
ncbi:NADH-quinone oxidoreductase subunit A [Mucilaginibacter robiniae]|uniref:NADH-quinone oxidoreductase subunit A n=1 Tax=Mucilaginibacter robiniae TaxID=2728022 RepID=A0A7L5E3P1_9SPHI|nr:NADH-quinone oxidoreductase subunit A [Mucilaginibacter robiniae]QJD97960.1 NADH-quinone oxidoreductase subunit A [Mucilaginibacter robiniae]